MQAGLFHRPPRLKSPCAGGPLPLNGVRVTWTLPDFASTFVAFLSGIQILFVAVVGLVLTGVTALIAFWTAPTESAL